MKRLIVMLLILSLGISAVSLFAQEEDDTDTLELLEDRGVQVRPLEEVTESAEQILDITSDSARVNFVGTIPLACTVLFGTTTNFGNASIDQNMAGATIIEHNPLLLDLAPDTEYYYRVQGSAEDGTFYIGEIRTFRTAEESDDTSNNLLSPERGAEVIGVSSNFGGQANDGRWGILNAFDGNVNTAWSSNGDGDDAWFEVQLAERSRINRIEFQSRLMTDGSSQITAFTLTNDAGEEFGPFEVPDAEELYEFNVNIVTKTLRFDVEASTGGNTGAVEVAVYGEPAEG